MNNIRLATKKDIKKIFELLNHDRNLSVDGKTGEYEKEDVEEFVGVKINKTFVYEEHNKILGVLITQFWKTYIYLHLIIVDKNYQGKGIGEKLISYMENIAKKRRIKAIESITGKKNKKMKSLLKKMNYKRGKAFIPFRKEL